MKETFGDRLMKLLNDKNMSQREVAIKSGCTPSAMCHYIKGDRVPRANVLAKIAEILNTTSDYLMNGTASKSDEEIKYATTLIARNADKISEKEKMKIIEILIKHGKGEYDAFKK